MKFKKGDIITITQKEDGGWWEGTLDGKTGWFPSNYVEELSSAPGKEVEPQVPQDLVAKNIDYRQQVIRDMLEKEQEFVSISIVSSINIISHSNMLISCSE